MSEERTCEVLVVPPTRRQAAGYLWFFCGTPATQRYPASGGGFMYLCDEHSIPHLGHTEPRFINGDGGGFQW